MAYKIVISADFPKSLDNTGEYNGTTERFDLPIDYVASKSINLSSNIVTQPMMSGDTISDHMYRLPTTYSISGTFSNNGSAVWNGDNSYSLPTSIIPKGGGRLANVEAVFEYIKNNGILCDISTFEENDSQKTKVQFTNRKGMALKDIKWNERQNCVDFDFNFQEVIMVNVTETNVAVDDKYLPSVVYPTTKTLGEMLVGNPDFAELICKVLAEWEYFEEEFVIAVGEGQYTTVTLGDLDFTWRMTLVSIITGTVAGIIGTAALIAGGVALGIGAASVAAAIFPVGTIIVGVAAALFVGITATVQYTKKEQAKDKVFALVDGSVESGLEKLGNLINEVAEGVNKAMTDVSIYSLNVETDANGNESKDPVTTLITIGGNSYYLNFTYDTNLGVWDCKITTLDETPLTTVSTTGIPAIGNIFSVDENNNLWFRDETKEYQVYAIKPSLIASENSSDTAQAAVKERINDLMIVVFKGHPTDTIGKVPSIIEEVLLDIGYQELG